MMMLERWHELLLTLQHNKLRTALTALSVSWGIFVLVILLGAGSGLEQSVEHNFEKDATNSILVRSGRTSLPFAGRPLGRKITFHNGDTAAISASIPGVDHLSGRFIHGDDSVSFGQRHASFDIRGCEADYQFLAKTTILSGRFINDRDVEFRRKVAVIGPEVVAALFDGADPLGQYIQIRRNFYQVVGTYEDEGGEVELRKIYIPLSTAQLAYQGVDKVHQILYTVGSAGVAESNSMADSTRDLIAHRYDFAPEDRRALTVHNNLADFTKITQIFGWIRSFVWIVGLGTIMAGVVGVSNVILISVQERTREIGIRKALGATPAAIVRSILAEALLVTSFAGYSGLIAGIGTLEIVARNMPQNDYVRDPHVDVRVALMAVAVLVIAGAFAGLAPAVRAVRVSPVVAMREE